MMAMCSKYVIYIYVVYINDIYININNKLSKER